MIRSELYGLTSQLRDWLTEPMMINLFFNFICLNPNFSSFAKLSGGEHCKSLLFSALHIDKWTWVLVMLLSWVTDRWIFLKLPFVFLLGKQAYRRLYTCKKTKWWHDRSNPTSLLWGAFKLFLKNHKENCKSLGHPHHKYIYLNQSRAESKSGGE